MPYRSSSEMAMACSRRVGSRSGGGSSDQRPLTVGGPLRDGQHGPAVARPPPPAAPAPRRPDSWSRPPPPECRRPAPTCALAGHGLADGRAAAGRLGRVTGVTGRPLPSTVRSGASVSLVSRPAQTRSQMALATAWSPAWPAAPAGRRRAWRRPGRPAPRKNSAPPPPSASSSASCTGVMVISPGSGSSSGARLGRAPARPSRRRRAARPRPAQTTSPAAVSSSSSAGE